MFFLPFLVDSENPNKCFIANIDIRTTSVFSEELQSGGDLSLSHFSIVQAGLDLRVTKHIIMIFVTSNKDPTCLSFIRWEAIRRAVGGNLGSRFFIDYVVLICSLPSLVYVVTFLKSIKGDYSIPRNLVENFQSHLIFNGRHFLLRKTSFNFRGC